MEDLIAQSPVQQDFVPPVAAAQQRNAAAHEPGSVSQSWARPSNAASAAPAPCAAMQGAKHTTGIDIRWGAAAQCDILCDISQGATKGAACSVLHASSGADGSSLVLLDNRLQCHVFRVWQPQPGVPQLRQVRFVTPRAERLALLPPPPAAAVGGSASTRKASALVSCGAGTGGGSVFTVLFPCSGSDGDAPPGSAVHTLMVPPCPPATAGSHPQHRPWLQEHEVDGSGGEAVVLGPAWPLSGARLSAVAGVPCLAPCAAVLLVEGGAGGGCTGMSLWCPVGRCLLAMVGQGSLPDGAVRNLKVGPPEAAAGDRMAAQAVAETSAGALHLVTLECHGTPVQRDDGSFAPSSWAWGLKGGSAEGLHGVSGGPLEVLEGGVHFLCSRRFTWAGKPLLHGGEVMLPASAAPQAPPPSAGVEGAPPGEQAAGVEAGSAHEWQLHNSAYSEAGVMDAVDGVEPPSEARDPPMHPPRTPGASDDESTPPGSPQSPQQTAHPPAAGDASSDDGDTEPRPHSHPLPAPSDHPLARRGGGTVRHAGVDASREATDATHSTPATPVADHDATRPAVRGADAAGATRGRQQSVAAARRRVQRVRGRFGRRVSSLQGAAAQAPQKGDNQSSIAGVQRVLGQHPQAAPPADAVLPAVVHTLGPLLNPGVAATQPAGLTGQPAHPLAAPTLCSLAALDAEIQRVQAAHFDAAAAARWVRAQRKKSGADLRRSGGSALAVSPGGIALGGREDAEAAVQRGMQQARQDMGWVRW